MLQAKISAWRHGPSRSRLPTAVSFSPTTRRGRRVSRSSRSRGCGPRPPAITTQPRKSSRLSSARPCAPSAACAAGGTSWGTPSPHRGGKPGGGSGNTQHRRGNHRCRRKAHPQPRILLKTAAPDQARSRGREPEHPTSPCIPRHAEPGDPGVPARHQELTTLPPDQRPDGGDDKDRVPKLPS